MGAHSAGILLFRFRDKKLEVLLVHPGGPFWAKKDAGAWSIPKGIFTEEPPLEAAKREFKEETGYDVDGEFIGLGELKQPSGKTVHVWALQKDIDETKVVSNTFRIEWPRNSGKFREYPEVDRAQWFELEEARKKLSKGQVGFLDRLAAIIKCH
ncbi:MAG: NUDIX domain-containing protein [Deferribacteres bacterium]|nr:NUDIX domain-containing protein [Deferribacteres bacterium]